MARWGRQFLLAGLVVSMPVCAQVFRCTDAAGKVTYQQKPCDGGRGAKLDATPANQEIREAAPAVVAPSAADASPAPAARPETPPDPLATYQQPGLRLMVGLNLRGVVQAWGLPTSIRSDRNFTFLHWCDARSAMLVDGLLRAWDAPFPDSVVGASLYRYGEPWTASSIRWGNDPNKMTIKNYSGPIQGRGEVREWSKLRWVVTDGQGNITGWCDAAEHRSPVTPPAFNPPWNNSVAR